MGELTERVGIGGSFLGETETRRRIRAGEHFMPTIGSRLSYDAWKAGRPYGDGRGARAGGGGSDPAPGSRAVPH